MLRFVDLGDQILEGEREFAWWDTINDRFLYFDPSMSWRSWEEFEQDWRDARGMDTLTRARGWPDIERFRRLFPEDWR
jgi:hypothetical protein